jgi:dTDP-4-amino-4,6-dideoxygalactose transaminase
LALGVGAGDEVITVSHTFIATAEAISLTGAKPVFVDVDENTYTMDPDRIEAAITPRTRAIIPVHLYGQPADMDPIVALAKRRGLAVVEDACQAHGARYRGRQAGSLGDIACFSFYPGKNLGAYGEGGGVTTNREDLIAKIKVLRDHGQPKKYYHSVIGWNGRMDGIQGAVLSVKLPHLDAANDARRRHAARYAELLSGVPGVTLPKEADYARHIYHIYAVHCPQRDRVLEQLAKRGVHCGIHYPVPLHLQEAYANLRRGPGSFPVSERRAAEELSLPMFPELTDEQVRYVAAQLREVVGKQ